MKLELVMLATVFSMITERHVEAHLKCYSKLYWKGLNAKITNSMPDITSLFPNGARSCNVPAKSVLIFYSKTGYRGKFISYTGSNVRDTLFLARYGFVFKSLLLLANPSNDGGLLLFKEENFQGGVVQSINPKNVTVQGNIKFGSAVVLPGTLDWTVIRKCQKGQCSVCLKRIISKASFIKSIDNTGMWETESILPGVCKGTIYAGESRVQGNLLKCYHCPRSNSAVVDTSKCAIKSNCRQCLYKNTGSDWEITCSHDQSQYIDLYLYKRGRITCTCPLDLCNADEDNCKKHSYHLG